jgi:hypothetical protein
LSRFDLNSDNYTELIQSPNNTYGSYTDVGYQCFFIQELGAYMYSNKFDSLKDFGIEATDDFYSLCLRKWEEEVFDAVCQRCGYMDFIIV